MRDAPPESCPRRILLAVTGMSPQVVTETLWALAVGQDPPFVPTEIHLVTTGTGERLLREGLLAPGGPLGGLCADYGLPRALASAAAVHVITDRDGRPLDDIRGSADNEAAADFLTDIVRSFTEDASSALHVSLAGGRKTMGYYLGYAVSLFGRPQDRLSHVLVDPDHESRPDFFYPPPVRGRVSPRGGRKGKPPASAVIELAVIPFVRLRDDLPTRYLEAHSRFMDVVAAANRSLGDPLLEIDTRRCQVRADGRIVIDANPRLVAFCWWHAEAARGRTGSAGGAAGVDWTDRRAVEDFLEKLARLLPRESPDHKKTRDALAWRQADSRGEDLLGYFSPLRTRAMRCFRDALGPAAARRYDIRRLGPRGRGHVYALALETSRIRVL